MESLIRETISLNIVFKVNTIQIKSVEETKVYCKFSSVKKIISGESQASILGYVSVFTWSPIYWLCNDNTPFVVRDNIADMISALEQIGEKPFIWLSDNQMKLNTVKCHYLSNT